jgi:hypothetical protein
MINNIQYKDSKVDQLKIMTTFGTKDEQFLYIKTGKENISK